MIDPTRVVPPDPGIDYVAIIEREKESVMRLVRIRRRIVFRLFPRTMLPFVFDNPGTFANLRGRKNAAAMNAGFSDDDSFRGAGRAVTIGSSAHGVLNHKRIPPRTRAYQPSEPAAAFRWPDVRTSLLFHRS